MARTQAQREADEALEAAIQRTIEAYRDEESLVGVIGDWIVVCAETKPDLEDADGDLTAYSILMPSGGLPFYRSIGLLSAGTRYINIAQDGPSDD